MAGDIPTGTYTLQLGSTFSETPKKDTKRYHSLRYDFKPKSLSSADSETYIAFGANGDVHVAVPTEGDNLMVYKGSKKEAKPKECLLFFDKKTGTVRLEKISSNINVKKTRESGGSTESVLRAEMAKLKASGTKMAHVSSDNQPEKSHQDESSSSSSSSDSDSGSDSDDDSKPHGRKRESSNSDMSDMESQLLASVNSTAPPPAPSAAPPRHDDMPSFDMPVTRPPPPQQRPPPPSMKSSSHDHLGLNLSESSDDED